MLQSNQPIDVNRNLTFSFNRSASELAIKPTSVGNTPKIKSNRVTGGSSNVYASIPKVYT